MGLTCSCRAVQVKRIGSTGGFPTTNAGGHVTNGQERRTVFRCLNVARKGLVFDSILPDFRVKITEKLYRKRQPA
jgi:hypothetical protein